MNETPLDIVRKYTRGVVYPARKNVVLDSLERNGAPREAVELVRSEPHERYAHPAEVMMVLHRAA